MALGQIIRQNNRTKSYLDAGELIPAEMCIQILLKEINNLSGLILIDGFPRSMNNLICWNKYVGVSPKYVFVLDIENQKIEARRQSRRRRDDTVQLVEKRVNSYIQETLTLLPYFNPLIVKTIDASQPADVVYNTVLNILHSV